LLVLSQASAIAASLDDKRVGLTVPAAPWMLTLKSGELALERQQLKPDGRSGYFLLNDKKNYMYVSLFIEPAEECKDSRSCRDMVWKAGNPAWENPQKVVSSNLGDVYYFEFFMPSFRGQPIEQQHMYAQFVVDGYWVDMHISKVLYKPEDRKLFERIIKSVKFEPKKEAESQK
jgi:hypothetical protein